MFLLMFFTDEVELAPHLQGQALRLRASRMCTHLLTPPPGSPPTVDSRISENEDSTGG